MILFFFFFNKQKDYFINRWFDQNFECYLIEINFFNKLIDLSLKIMINSNIDLENKGFEYLVNEKYNL